MSGGRRGGGVCFIVKQQTRLHSHMTLFSQPEVVDGPPNSQTKINTSTQKWSIITTLNSHKTVPQKYHPKTQIKQTINRYQTHHAPNNNLQPKTSPNYQYKPITLNITAHNKSTTLPKKSLHNTQTSQTTQLKSKKHTQTSPKSSTAPHKIS